MHFATLHTALASIFIERTKWAGTIYLQMLEVPAPHIHMKQNMFQEVYRV
jgi:hypothetical protein